MFWIHFSSLTVTSPVLSSEQFTLKPIFGLGGKNFASLHFLKKIKKGRGLILHIETLLAKPIPPQSKLLLRMQLLPKIGIEVPHRG